MYTIKSKNRYSDALRIKSGSKTMTLTVDLDVARMAQRVRKCQQELAQAQTDAQKAGTPESVEAYGKAIQALVEAVFGPEQAEKLAAFYEGHFDSLLDDILPFIFQKTIPKLKKLNERRANQLYQVKKAK